MLPSCLMLGALCLKPVSTRKEPRLFNEHAELEGEEPDNVAPVTKRGQQVKRPAHLEGAAHHYGDSAC